MNTEKNDRFLFCNVAYLNYYDSNVQEEQPKNGGAYVTANGTGGEINNFRVYPNGKCYGYVEPGSRNGQKNRLHIEKIDSEGAGQDKLTNVTVVFCATSDKGPVVVGWYRHATVYRAVQHSTTGDYNLVTVSTDAVLVDPDMRIFKAPRARSDGFGFGENNYWYADQRNDRVHRYINELEKFMDGSDQKDNLLFSASVDNDNADPQKYTESADGRQTTVNVYERNPQARRACLKKQGCQCAICGFDAGKVYGKMFKGKIEVHHVVPISERTGDYKVSPATDLIPVCPNCHMILHTKVDGKYLSVEELKKLLHNQEVHNK